MTYGGDGAHRRAITRTKALRNLGVGGAAFLTAGCNGVMGGDGGDTSAPEESTPEFLDESIARTYNSLEENIGQQYAEDFDQAIKGEDGYVPNASTLSDYLSEIDEAEYLDVQHRDGVAASIGREGTLNEEGLSTVHRWLDSPTELQKEVFSHGLTPHQNGYQIESETEGFALNDTDDYGVRNSLETFLGIDSKIKEGIGETQQPGVKELIQDLTHEEEGYTREDLTYLEKAVEYAENHDLPWSKWNQAADYELLHQTAGQVQHIDSDILEQIETPARSELINAKHQELGTAGAEKFYSNAEDDIPDHFKYLINEFIEDGPLEDVKLDYQNPNVMIEVGTSSGIPQLTDKEEELLVDLGKNDPPGDQEVNFHFIRTVEQGPEYDQFWNLRAEADEVRETAGLGTHYIYLDHPPIRRNGNIVGGGVARTGIAYASGAKETTGEVRASTVGHELGHTMGLDAGDSGGVDRERPPEEYPSMMNYSIPAGFIDFSDGDWEHLLDDKFMNSFVDQSRLDDIWNNGF